MEVSRCDLVRKSRETLDQGWQFVDRRMTAIGSGRRPWRRGRRPGIMSLGTWRLAWEMTGEEWIAGGRSGSFQLHGVRVETRAVSTTEFAGRLSCSGAAFTRDTKLSGIAGDSCSDDPGLACTA